MLNVVQERRKAAELEATNQLLQRHLVESTNSFREALQLVESLMGGEFWFHSQRDIHHQYPSFSQHSFSFNACYFAGGEGECLNPTSVGCCKERWL